MAKIIKIQQFHESAKSAKIYLTKSLNDPHHDLARAYQGMNVTSVRVARHIDKGQPNVPINGRRLFNITLTKRRKK